MPPKARVVVSPPSQDTDEVGLDEEALSVQFTKQLEELHAMQLKKRQQAEQDLQHAVSEVDSQLKALDKEYEHALTRLRHEQLMSVRGLLEEKQTIEASITESHEVLERAHLQTIRALDCAIKGRMSDFA